MEVFSCFLQPPVARGRVSMSRRWQKRLHTNDSLHPQTHPLHPSHTSSGMEAISPTHQRTTTICFRDQSPVYVHPNYSSHYSHQIQKLQSDWGRGTFLCSQPLRYSFLGVLPDFSRLFFFWIAMWGTPENWGWDEFYTNGIMWASLADSTVTEEQLVKRTATLLRFYMDHAGWVGRVTLLVLVERFPTLMLFDPLFPSQWLGLSWMANCTSPYLHLRHWKILLSSKHFPPKDLQHLLCFRDSELTFCYYLSLFM